MHVTLASSWKATQYALRTPRRRCLRRRARRTVAPIGKPGPEQPPIDPPSIKRRLCVVNSSLLLHHYHHGTHCRRPTRHDIPAPVQCSESRKMLNGMRLTHTSHNATRTHIGDQHFLSGEMQDNPQVRDCHRTREESGRARGNNRRARSRTHSCPAAAH